MNTRLIKLGLILFSSLFFAACGDNKKNFIVEGIVSNSDSLTLFLERREHSALTVLDSIKLDANGKFSFKQETLPHAEFYRLRLDNQAINFSVDSTETINIKADKASFATGYEVEGSYNSSKIQEAFMNQYNLQNKIIGLRKKHSEKTITDQQFLDSIGKALEIYRDDARNMILDDYRSTASYFALFQKVDDMLLFDPSDKKDLALFRAVATVWDTYFPNSPRSKQLKDYTLNAIGNLERQKKQEEAIGDLANRKALDAKEFFEVALPNVDNKEISTASLRGKIVLLDFTVYTGNYSVAHNMKLNQAYEQYKSKIEIYQVSLDKDKHIWQNAAVNLPWICVRDEQSTESNLVKKFNIEGLPTTFILDKSGNIVKKLSIMDDISKEITKVL